MQPLHISEFGVFLGKHSGRLAVRKGKETLSEHPLLLVEQVLVSGRGVSFSTDLVEECCSRGIPITLLTPGGKPYARVASARFAQDCSRRRPRFSHDSPLSGRPRDVSHKPTRLLTGRPWISTASPATTSGFARLD